MKWKRLKTCASNSQDVALAELTGKFTAVMFILEKQKKVYSQWFKPIPLETRKRKEFNPKQTKKKIIIRSEIDEWEQKNRE